MHRVMAERGGKGGGGGRAAGGGGGKGGDDDGEEEREADTDAAKAEKISGDEVLLYDCLQVALFEGLIH
jgi:hypothetical protein